jgi:hypothetical protein
MSVHQLCIDSDVVHMLQFPSTLATPISSASSRKCLCSDGNCPRHYSLSRFISSTAHSLRNTTKPLRPSTAEAPVEVLRRVRAKSLPAIGTSAVRLLLRLGDLFLKLRGAGVDELELRELGVEDANDLCELDE